MTLPQGLISDVTGVKTEKKRSDGRSYQKIFKKLYIRITPLSCSVLEVNRLLENKLYSLLSCLFFQKRRKKGKNRRECGLVGKSFRTFPKNVCKIFRFYAHFVKSTFYIKKIFSRKNRVLKKNRYNEIMK